MTDNNFIIDGYPVRKYGYTDGRHTNYRPLKLLLMEVYGVCYHCGRAVKDYPQIDGNNLPMDAATIDHLKPRQFRKKHEITEKVLCCNECNIRLNDYVQSHI